MDALLKHQGVDAPPPHHFRPVFGGGAARQRARRKIAAIKLYLRADRSRPRPRLESVTRGRRRPLALELWWKSPGLCDTAGVGRGQPLRSPGGSSARARPTALAAGSAPPTARFGHALAGLPASGQWLPSGNPTSQQGPPTGIPAMTATVPPNRPASCETQRVRHFHSLSRGEQLMAGLPAPLLTRGRTQLVGSG